MTGAAVNPRLDQGRVEARLFSRARPPRVIRARKQVRASPERLYRFLAALDNHWLLTDRFVSLVCLHGPVDSRTGGEITIRGPWGLRRHARTWLDAPGQPRLLVGTAVVGRGTVARVTWALTPIPGGTEVALTASVLAATVLDRALLMVATPWLRRRFLAAIARLEEHAAGHVPPPAPAVPRLTRC